MSGLNLKSYIGALREWVGKDADRHESSLLTICHPTLIKGKGHAATLRIDVARALVALAEQTSADKVLVALSGAISDCERERARIAADGTGRVREPGAAKEWTSPLLARKVTQDEADRAAAVADARIAQAAPRTRKPATLHTVAVTAPPARTT